MAAKSSSQKQIDKLSKELLTAKQSNAKTSAILASIGDGVIVTDDYGRIEQVNQLACQMLGYTSDEMIGKHFIKVVREVNEDGSLVENIDRPITRAFLTGQPVYERTSYLTKDNSKLPVDFVVAPIIFNNAPSGAIEIIHDLTDDLMKEKIQSEFISIASHQLRTPLASINTYAQMLSGGYAGKVSPKQSRFINAIESAAERMNELIYTLLNVTRIEAGNININVEDIGIGDLCQDIVTSVTPLAKEKNISIKCPRRTDFVIPSDPILLREALSNLLSNAIKYTPSNGKVALDVKSNSRIIFSIKDNGYGIPDKDKDYIFSKFYRANNTQNYDVSGTGIGLYLVQQIADKLGGDIWFKSEEGKGSVFYFALPITGTDKKQGNFTLEASKPLPAKG